MQSQGKTYIAKCFKENIVQSFGDGKERQDSRLLDFCKVRSFHLLFTRNDSALSRS